jgi:hypothetical protein
LKTVNIDGNEYEAGGSVIHEKNLYMKRFADELGEIIFLLKFSEAYVYRFKTN